MSRRGGVPKIPIAGTQVRRLGLEGDAHRLPPPAHGGPLKSVSLYSVEAIERLRADGHQGFPGAQGENLTLEGIDWATLQPGDRLRIGNGGPLIELTQFATPCEKQARWFIGGRIRRISASAYPKDTRWYASVVEEGPVAPGDRVELIGRADAA
jgi:MOSC domain-containing protein YiiM